MAALVLSAGLLLIASLGRLASAGPATMSVDPLDETRRQERKSVEQGMSGESFAPVLLHDAVALELENQHLVLHTCLPTRPGNVRLPLTDFPFLCSASVNRGVGVPPEGACVPWIFLFTCWDFSLPDAVANSVTVQQTMANLQLARNWEMGDDNGNIILTQQPGDDLDNPNGGVQLKVHILRGEASKPQVDLDLSAPDLLTLYREHRDEVRRYVVPMLRQIQADGLLRAVDVQTAWQVFSPDFPIDPAIAAEVQQIIPQLDAEDFHQREAASAKLKAMGAAAIPALRKMDRRKLSAEQNARVGNLLSAFPDMNANDRQKLLSDQAFLLECLSIDDQPIAGGALDRLNKLTGEKINFDLTLKDQARQSAVYRLRKQLKLEPTSQP